MKLEAEHRLPPLAAWLILAGASLTLFPLHLEHLYSILIATIALSISWLPGRRYRSAPFLALYALTALTALNVPLPLPNAWHPLVILILTLTIWGAVLTVPLSILIFYLLRTARPNHTRHHSR